MRDMKQTIEKYCERKLWESEVEYWTEVIQKNAITDRKTRRQHVRAVQGKISDNRNKIESGVCPKCGGKLVKRNGKYGSFMGCSNYPKCRYTLKE